jgi:hypothetical protein
MVNSKFGLKNQLNKEENTAQKEKNTAQKEWYLSRISYRFDRYNKVLSLYGEETQDITA